MLMQFEENLKRIEASHGDNFYSEIRSRVGKRAASMLEKRLRNLILLTPKLISQAHKHCNRREVPSEIKKLVGFTLTYFYHPMDFLPDGKDQLIGYLDDAYFVALTYEEILKSLSGSQEVELSDFDQDFLKNIASLKKSVQAVIPEEAEKISRILSELREEKVDSFYVAVA